MEQESLLNSVILALLKRASMLNGSHPTMKNCEGRYDWHLHTRLLRCPGWNFQAIEASRGLPGAPRRISVYMHICKLSTAPPCLGKALRRGALIKLHFK